MNIGGSHSIEAQRSVKWHLFRQFRAHFGCIHLGSPQIHESSMRKWRSTRAFGHCFSVVWRFRNMYLFVHLSGDMAFSCWWCLNLFFSVLARLICSLSLYSVHTTCLKRICIKCTCPGSLSLSFVAWQPFHMGVGIPSMSILLYIGSIQMTCTPDTRAWD